MALRIALGIGPLLPASLPPPYNRTDVLCAIAERAQPLCIVDVQLHDWLEQGEARTWPGTDEATWYKVEMPDIMGPVDPPTPPDIRERWSRLQARPGVELDYPRGAICIPWVQLTAPLVGFGELDVFDGLMCIPLKALRDIVAADAEDIERLIEDCARACVPVSIVNSP